MTAQRAVILVTSPYAVVLPQVLLSRSDPDTAALFDQILERERAARRAGSAWLAEDERGRTFQCLPAATSGADPVSAVVVSTPEGPSVFLFGRTEAAAAFLEQIDRRVARVVTVRHEGAVAPAPTELPLGLLVPSGICPYCVEQPLPLDDPDAPICRACTRLGRTPR